MQRLDPSSIRADSLQALSNPRIDHLLWQPCVTASCVPESLALLRTARISCLSARDGYLILQDHDLFPGCRTPLYDGQQAFPQASCHAWRYG
jgi:hypothetical protein